MMTFEFAEHLLFQSVQWLRLLIETAGVLVIALGMVCSLHNLFKSTKSNGGDRFTSLRMSLGRYLILALEFQLAADVLSTVLSPSWQELGQLAVVATIRTALNHFLAQELQDLRHGTEPGATV
jgi:uncharacterized membrane protein